LVSGSFVRDSCPLPDALYHQSAWAEVFLVAEAESMGVVRVQGRASAVEVDEEDQRLS